jgi:hypothetical protein
VTKEQHAELFREFKRLRKKGLAWDEAWRQAYRNLGIPPKGRRK